MRVYAHHDSKGNVDALVSFDGPDGAGLMLAPRPGRLVSEVEGISLRSGEKGLEELQEIARTHAMKKLRPLELGRKRG
jgi:hypothetical protein